MSPLNPKACVFPVCCQPVPAVFLMRPHVSQATICVLTRTIISLVCSPRVPDVSLQRYRRVTFRYERLIGVWTRRAPECPGGGRRFFDRAGADVAVMLPLLERAGDRIHRIPQVCCTHVHILASCLAVSRRAVIIFGCMVPTMIGG